MILSDVRFRWAICVLFLSAFPFAGAWAHDELGCEVRDVGEIPVVETGVTGRAVFCVKPEGLTGQMTLKGLMPGNAYTTWWIYFDDPASCVGGGDGVCGLADFGGENPLGVFGRMDSGVVSHNGKLIIKGTLNGMEPSSGSQVWLLTFGHGAASDDGRQLARQLLTPENPDFGAPHLGIVGSYLGYPVANAVFAVE